MLPFIPLHFPCAHFWRLVHVIEFLPTPLLQTWTCWSNIWTIHYALLNTCWVQEFDVHIFTNYYCYYCCCCYVRALCMGPPGLAGTTRNIYQLTFILIINCFLSASHLLWSIASSLFNLLAWQSFFTASIQVLFGLPLVPAPFTLFSVHFFTQSLSPFCNTCPYKHSLFCCCTKIMSSK